MDFYISTYEDIVTLRRETRSMMRSINASLPSQAHISWLTDSIARQMLATGGAGSLMIVETIEEQRRYGIHITCAGDWLKEVGRFYQMHLVPALSRKDEVQFASERIPPQMSIVCWV